MPKQRTHTPRGGIVVLHADDRMSSPPAEALPPEAKRAACPAGGWRVNHHGEGERVW